jgi:outer membrane protein TolC
MGEAIRARYSTAGNSLTDVARLDLEVAKVQRALARIAGARLRAQSTLNALWARPASAPIPELAAMPPETVRLATDDLLARAQRHRAQIAAADARTKGADARLDAATKDANNPEFEVGVAYWQDPRMAPGFGLMFATSLPWFWGPGPAKKKQAEDDATGARFERAGAVLDAQGAIGEATARLAAIEKQLQQLDREAMPAASRAIEAMTSAFVTGNVTLFEWVDAARTTLDLEMESSDLRADLARAVAAMERAVGEPLPHVALTSEASP